MRGKILAIFVSCMFLSLPLMAQGPSKGSGLTEAELNGKGMFQQRCSICHTPPVPGGKTFGPVLNSGLVTGKEAAMREFIVKGTPRMPGFQYGLEPKEIDDIIAYLKTVKKPDAKAPEAKPEGMEQRD
jgi:mono/diheme cytochrome c family protein